MQEKQQALGELDGKVQRTLTSAREYKLRPTKIHKYICSDLSGIDHKWLTK